MFKKESLGQAALYDAIIEKTAVELRARARLICRKTLQGTPSLIKVYAQIAAPCQDETRGLDSEEILTRYLILVVLRLHSTADHVMEDRRRDIRNLVIPLLHRYETSYGAVQTWFQEVKEKVREVVASISYIKDRYRTTEFQEIHKTAKDPGNRFKRPLRNKSETLFYCLIYWLRQNREHLSKDYEDAAAEFRKKRKQFPEIGSLSFPQFLTMVFLEAEPSNTEIQGAASAFTNFLPRMLESFYNVLREKQDLDLKAEKALKALKTFKGYKPLYQPAFQVLLQTITTPKRDLDDKCYYKVVVAAFTSSPEAMAKIDKEELPQLGTLAKKFIVFMAAALVTGIPIPVHKGAIDFRYNMCVKIFTRLATDETEKRILNLYLNQAIIFSSVSMSNPNKPDKRKGTLEGAADHSKKSREELPTLLQGQERQDSRAGKIKKKKKNHQRNQSVGNVEIHQSVPAPLPAERLDPIPGASQASGSRASGGQRHGSAPYQPPPGQGRGAGRNHKPPKLHPSRYTKKSHHQKYTR